MVLPDAQLLAPNESVGDAYLVERLLGSGGMGRVYLARDIRLERQVAIKVLLPDAARDEDAEARFVREARTLSRVNHPNVVAIHSFGRHKGQWYIAMEHVDGEGLDTWLQERGPMSLPDAASVVRQIASGIAEAHAVGIIHRDIKPANVLLRRLASGALLAKVLDFGLARSARMSDDSGISLPGALLGTPTYMSPEQIQGTAVDGRSDLYSLGVLAFQTLTARPPYLRPTLQATLVAHLAAELPALVLPGVPASVAGALQRQVHRAMAKRPEDRHATIVAFAEAFCEAAGVAGGGGLIGGEPAVRCATCGRGDARPGGFCPGCGSPVPKALCPTCQTPRAGERFVCVECGGALVQAQGRGALLHDEPHGHGAASLSTATATVLVARLDGAEVDLPLLRDVSASFVATVEREGGRVLAVLGNELLAIFGLGGMREWETEAAVDGALALRGMVRETLSARGAKAGLHIGIEVGPIGTVGAGVAWGTAMAGGQAVQVARLAARQGQEADVGICLADRAWREVRTAYLAERVASGRWAIVRRKPVSFLDHDTSSRQPPLVGREVELAQLRRIQRRVLRQGRGAVAPLSGLAGVGKSRLVGEFLRRVEGDSEVKWHIDVARCSAGGVPVAFEPFAQIIRRRIGADEQVVDAEALAQRLAELPGMQAMDTPVHVVRRRVAALGRIAGATDRGAHVGTPRPASEAETQAAFEAVAAYLKGAAAQGPVAVVIEDLHRARGQTLALLEHLIRASAALPVLFVLVMRESRAEAVMSTLDLSVTQASLIEVPPLEIEECGELMSSLLHGFEPPHALVKAVQGFSEGLPLRVEEAIDALVGDGVLRQAAGGWEVGDPAGARRALDRTMSELVLDRVGRLPPAEQQVLRALAVAGTLAPLGLIGAVLDREASPAQIEGLLRSGLVHERQAGRFGEQRELTFRSPQVREIVLQSTDPATRAEHHRRAAGWMTAWTGPRPADHGPQIAQHFLAAGDHRASTGSLLEAARDALYAFSNRDAFDILLAAAEVGRKWVESDPSDPEARAQLAEVFIALAEVGQRVGDTQAGLAAAEEVLALLAPGGPERVLRCRAVCAHGDLLEQLGRYAEAIAAFEQAAPDAIDDPGLDEPAAHARSRLAMVLHKAGELDRAQRVAEQALARWAGRTETAFFRTYGRLEQALGHVASARGRFEIASRHYETAIAWVERAGDVVGVAMATVSMGNLAFRARDLRRAEQLYRDAVRQFRSLDVVRGRAMAQTNLGNVMLEEGRYAEAMKQLREAEDTMRRSGTADMLPETLRLIAACSLALGDVRAANTHASEAVERAREMGNRALIDATRKTQARVRRASEAIERITLTPGELEGPDTEPDPGFETEGTMPYIRGPAPRPAEQED